MSQHPGMPTDEQQDSAAEAFYGVDAKDRPMVTDPLAYAVAALEDYRTLMLNGRDSYEAGEIDHLDRVIDGTKELADTVRNVRVAVYILLHQDDRHAESLAIVENWLKS